MRNAFMVVWQDEPNAWETLQMKSFKTKDEAISYVQANNLNAKCYEIIDID